MHTPHETPALKPSKQRGFNIIELIIVMGVIALLAALALPAYQDNSRRAKLSEVLLAFSPCRMAVTEGWSKETVSPGAGNWGCERSAVASKYADTVQTSEDGEVRIRVRGLDSAVNGLYVYLKPYEVAEPPATGGGVFAVGQNVRSWKCGIADNDPASMALMNALPSGCRSIINITATTWLP